MTEVLSRRYLNRATLARQYLLERATVPAIDAIEHLAGMQPQAPIAPYIGLWARLQDFAQGELSALPQQRRVVRLHPARKAWLEWTRDHIHLHLGQARGIGVQPADPARARLAPSRLR
jgi:hypothetical protein